MKNIYNYTKFTNVSRVKQAVYPLYFTGNIDVSTAVHRKPRKKYRPVQVSTRPKRNIPGMNKCNNCPICPFVTTGQRVKSTQTNFKIDINMSVDRQTKNSKQGKNNVINKNNNISNNNNINNNIKNNNSNSSFRGCQLNFY